MHTNTFWLQLRYVCLSIHSIIEPLISFAVTTSLKSAIGDGGFLLAARTPPLQAQHMALEWGRYMRVQLHRWIMVCGQHNCGSGHARLREEEHAHQEGLKVYDLVWDELAKGVVYGNHLHHLLWNLGWELEVMGLFWNEVLMGFNEKIEKGKGRAEEPKTSWFVYER